MKKKRRKPSRKVGNQAERMNAMQRPNDCDEAKNAFIRNVSHEIRTPMNAIMGFAQMLKQSGLSPQQTDYVDVILDSGNKLLLILENLLDLSNLQLGKVHLNTSQCRLEAFFRSIWLAHEPMIQAKNLEPILQLDPDLPIVMLDCEKLQRVLGFVLSNAVKFTDQGFVSLKVEHSQRNEEGYWVDIYVEDSGCGIEEERIQHIFGAFEQADSSLTRSYAGLGLGLGLSSRIVELLGGELSVSSMPGKGSMFHVRIPAEKV
jgi:signal transduction histidine kinase